MEPTQDVTIAGKTYQVGRFKARDGSWILSQLLTKILPAAIESGFKSAALSDKRSIISEEEFANIQAHALAVCRLYENGIPIPVFVRPNTFAVKELEYDTVTVMGLTLNALLFNLQPFFSEGGLSLILDSLKGLGLTTPISQT